MSITMERALRRYAAIQPIDLKSMGEIQNDLRAIAGDRHTHSNMIGSDECLLCGHDLRHEIHRRKEAIMADLRGRAVNTFEVEE